VRAYAFFSVHERVLDGVARELKSHHGVVDFGGFAWDESQHALLAGSEVGYRRLDIFTRDILPQLAAPPDLVYLDHRERLLGISLHRMIFAERHLLAGRSYDQILRLVEVLLRRIEAAYDAFRPDFIFSENVSCLSSYLHWAVARQRRIPFWAIGDARMPYRVSVYRDLQQMEHTAARFQDIVTRGLTPAERDAASASIAQFRNRPVRPTGMSVRARLPIASRHDLRRLT
jgi:hypothetical protein